LFVPQSSNASALLARAEATLRRWHRASPPDPRERARNDAVARRQGTRNPFVDCPALEARITDF